MIEWRSFLEKWVSNLNAPATEEQIEKAQKRLGVTLPPSYVSFLRVTNGCGQTTPFIDRVSPIEEVKWFSQENQEWIQAYEPAALKKPSKKYFQYAETGAGEHVGSHFASCLQISDSDDGVYLLNPKAVTADGEWEAWFFANWVPGALRFPSFEHLMVHEYRAFLQTQKLPIPTDFPVLPIPSPDAPRTAIKIIKPKPAQLTIDELIDQLNSKDAKQREKVAKALGRKLGPRGATPRPDLAEKLVKIFYASTDPGVRSICISGMANFAPKGAAPKPLFEALSDPEPGVVLSAIWALRYFPNPNALEPICKFIEANPDSFVGDAAIGYLQEKRDPRSIPSLVRVLFNTETKLAQNLNMAALALGKCGEPGFEQLEQAAVHADARIRFAAACGLDMSGHPRSSAILDKLESDADPNVVKRAKTRISVTMPHLLKS